MYMRNSFLLPPEADVEVVESVAAADDPKWS